MPTTPGKLVWISAFRLPRSDDYAHPALDHVVPHECADDAARREHERLFYDWLGMGLREKHKDLVEYLEALNDCGEQKAFLKGEWERRVPSSVRKPDKMLFDRSVSSR